MLNLGQINTLRALRQTDNGMYLIDEDDNEVLLPNKYIPVDFELGNDIDVFLYKDSEDRPIATNLKPGLMLHEYAPLKAKAVTDFGAFFDWGLEKDLLVPFSQQALKVKEGEIHVVYLYLDEKTDRLVGSTRFNHTLERDNVELEIGEEVDLLVYDDGDFGFSVLINKKYQGMLYYNEVFEPIDIGQELKGYVTKLRNDGKVDLNLNRFGYRGVDVNIKKLYKVLEENNGKIGLNDKSSPDDIYKALEMSKKVFKKAIGALYKQKRIIITDSGVELVGGKSEEEE